MNVNSAAAGAKYLLLNRQTINRIQDVISSIHWSALWYAESGDTLGMNALFPT
jgi:hypothetical protein